MLVDDGRLPELALPVERLEELQAEYLLRSATRAAPRGDSQQWAGEGATDQPRTCGAGTPPAGVGLQLLRRVLGVPVSDPDQHHDTLPCGADRAHRGLRPGVQ